MNSNELRGDVRYGVGKIEKAVGDVAHSRSLQKDGVVDQVAGTVEHLYGRAKSIADGALDAAPGIVDDARSAFADAPDRAYRVAQRGGEAASRAFRKRPAVWAVVAALSGYGLARLIHGRD